MVIRIRKSKKDRQNNGQKKKDRKTNNDLKNTVQKTKDRTTQILLKSTYALIQKHFSTENCIGTKLASIFKDYTKIRLIRSLKKFIFRYQDLVEIYSSLQKRL